MNTPRYIHTRKEVSLPFSLINCIVVGDCKSGKSSLLQALVYNRCVKPNQEYEPTVFDCYTAQGTIGNEVVSVNLLDIGGSASSETRRSLYVGANIILLVFDISQRGGHHSLSKFWIPEIRSYSEQVPIIICGCKTDLGINVRPFSENRKRRLTCSDFYVCSSKTRIGIAELFQSISKHGIPNYPKRNVPKPKRIDISQIEKELASRIKKENVASVHQSVKARRFSSFSSSSSASLKGTDKLDSTQQTPIKRRLSSSLSNAYSSLKGMITTPDTSATSTPRTVVSPRSVPTPISTSIPELGRQMSMESLVQVSHNEKKLRRMSYSWTSSIRRKRSNSIGPESPIKIFKNNDLQPRRASCAAPNVCVSEFAKKIELYEEMVNRLEHVPSKEEKKPWSRLSVSLTHLFSKQK
jgi:small GTP-binding protein